MIVDEMSIIAGEIYSHNDCRWNVFSQWLQVKYILTMIAGEIYSQNDCR